MMEEKMLPVPNEGHRRRQKQRRRRFPWGSIATVILVVAVCVYAFTLFGDKESPENYQENDTTTQGPDDVQGGLLDESSPQNTQTENDDTDWNLVLVNYENAIPENYEPKIQLFSPMAKNKNRRIRAFFRKKLTTCRPPGIIFLREHDKRMKEKILHEI